MIGSRAKLRRLCEILSEILIGQKYVTFSKMRSFDSSIGKLFRSRRMLSIGSYQRTLERIHHTNQIDL